ncbi:class II fructose-bisphosphate aldolase [Companilactobacillus zhachilii]|uniref:Class II fructose-bisphosphate aldolase n=1 Tax=Companilactobacillus zhachilii TaxID=2304606 RepID=A0A386PR48_9LACO|nr:class II fructose-bisphosphate aldolase [Companilactobacillus zhachilii]AYE37269.1 class II fructose-bisphosphate aldolase [Companilactobacillus zhachilii]
MVLVNTKDMVQKAKKGHYAVGSFNVTDIEMVRGIVSAAEKESSPVIIQFAELHDKYVPLDVIGPVMINIAKKATVPVAVHFDHGETFDNIVRAMKLGFTSVMIDASGDDFETNLRRTKEIVKIAKPLGISVEAELGPMNREGGGDDVDYKDLNKTYTDPQEAKAFIDESGIDMLAIAYGTVHGVYTQKPHLSFERLQKISNLVDFPLVVHGASGLKDEEYRKSVENGICKINYYSEMVHRVALGVQKKLEEGDSNKQMFISDVSIWETEMVEKEISERLRVFGSAGKA